MNKYILFALFSLVSACGTAENVDVVNPPQPPTVDPMEPVVVRGRAEYLVIGNKNGSNSLLLGMNNTEALSATGSTNVTYNNAASVSFTINVASLVAGAFTGETLSLGSVSLASLDDNNLKVCGVGGNQKCLKGIIRVYTTGSTAGFVQTVDSYGVPVYAGSLNPSTEVGLNTAGSVQVQVVNIAANKNRLKLVDFPTPTYSVSSDFSNAGSGSFSMQFVVEYALSL